MLPGDVYPPHDPALMASHPWKYLTGLEERLKADNKLTVDQKTQFINDAREDLELRPFVGFRGCYQHLIFDEIGIGIQWETPRDLNMQVDALANIFEDPSVEELGRLSDLAFEFKSIVDAKRSALEAENKLLTANTGSAPIQVEKRFSLNQSRKFIVVRILGKSRVMYYGKKDVKERWPYHFTLRIVDISGLEVNMDFWGSVVPALYHSLYVGQIVKLAGLKLREVYSKTSPIFTSLLDGKPITPTFEITYNPPTKGRNGVSVLVGSVAEWFNSKIASLSTPLRVSGIRDNMFNADQPEHSVVTALIDGLNSKTNELPVTSIFGLVSWIGPIEMRVNFGQNIYSRWVCLTDPKEADEPSSRSLFLQLRMGPSTEVPTALCATNVRCELHHGQMVAIATQFTQIQTWEEAQIQFAEDDLKMPKNAEKYTGRCSDWNWTPVINEQEDYESIFGARLVDEFLHPLPPTRPDSEDEAMAPEEMPNPIELMTQEPSDTARPKRAQARKDSATESMASISSQQKESSKYGKKKKSTPSVARPMEFESALSWVDKLPTLMRVDRIIACDKPFATTFLYSGKYDESKICGVKTEEEVDAIVAIGSPFAEQTVKLSAAERKSAGESKKATRKVQAELFWIAFSSHPFDNPTVDPVDDTASQASIALEESQQLAEEASSSQHGPRRSNRKRKGSDPAKANSSTSKRRAVIKTPKMYFCAVFPLSPFHLNHGNAYTFDRIAEDIEGIPETISRRFRLAGSLNKKYSMRVGVAIYKHSPDDTRFTIGNIWRHERATILETKKTTRASKRKNVTENEATDHENPK